MTASKLSELPKKRAELEKTEELLARLQDRNGTVAPERYERLASHYQEKIEQLEETVNQLIDDGKIREIELEDRLDYQRCRLEEAKAKLDEIESLYEEGLLDDETYHSDRGHFCRHKKEAKDRIDQIEEELKELRFYLTRIGDATYRKDSYSCVIGDLPGHEV